MSWWCNSCCIFNTNVLCVCGTFETPINADLGKCVPFRIKRDCEAPTIPPAPCADETFTIENNPDAVFPQKQFTIIAGLYDNLCLPILDESSIHILTVIE